VEAMIAAGGKTPLVGAHTSWHTLATSYRWCTSARHVRCTGARHVILIVYCARHVNLMVYCPSPRHLDSVLALATSS